ncbi:MAG: hypothetical protein DA407_04875 [Bacteroidetes bacterium]|nr:MAG: hypothetical protein DA407_04875 [Bacteroidota bacterium]
MKKYTLSTFSEVSQIISALSVVISLIYVGAQVNQNTKATQAAMRQSIADNDITYLMTGLDNSVLAVANYKYYSNIELSELEKNQLTAQQHVNFRVFENAFFQYQQELLEPETWARYKIIIKGLLTNNLAAKKMWSNMQKSFTKSFQEVVSLLLEDNTIVIGPNTKTVDSLDISN